MTKTRINPFKARREELGLTQQQAAVGFEVAIATWCRWEKEESKPLSDHMNRLLELLYYSFHPSESPKGCDEADQQMSLNSDKFQDHLTTCKACKLRIGFLHRGMDYM
jgi:transcriptional regulator with XRE-family HTH domain